MKKITIAIIIAFSLVLIHGIVAKEGHMMPKMKNHFKHLDINNNGKVSKKEWMAKFNKIDSNKNGSISKDEMKNHHNKMMGSHHEKKNHH